MTVDRGTFRLGLAIVGAGFLILLVGVLVLSYQDKTVPALLASILGTLLGAVAGLLAPAPHGVSAEPQPVAVTNGALNPLPVQEVAAEAVGIDAAGDPLPATIVRPRATNGRFAPRTTTPEV